MQAPISLDLPAQGSTLSRGNKGFKLDSAGDRSSECNYTSDVAQASTRLHQWFVSLD